MLAKKWAADISFLKPIFRLFSNAICSIMVLGGLTMVTPLYERDAINGPAIKKEDPRADLTGCNAGTVDTNIRI